MQDEDDASDPSARPRWRVIAATAVLVVAVCAARFDRADPGFLRRFTTSADDASDAAQYEAFVRAIRAFDASLLPRAPFAFRPLAPLLAAPLPLAPRTAIDVVNVLALAAAIVALDRFLALAGRGPRARALGGILFAASFPAFYYGAIGYVDPLLVALVTFGAWAARARRPIAVAALVAAAALVKETSLVLLCFVMLELGRVARRDAAWSLFGWVGATIGVRALLSMRAPPSLQSVDLELFVANLERPRAWASAALTLGAPAAIALARGRGLLASRRARPSLAAIGGSLALFAVTLPAAYADGRALWIASPFWIDLALRDA